MTSEAGDLINPKLKLNEIKFQLNIVIKYVDSNNDENIISTYYEHLR